MNKVITINLGGRVFNVEEPAFNRLNTYLETLRQHFKREEGGDEIIADIEARIGEMFHEKIKGKRDAVIIQDVEEVIAVMGEPEEVAGESAEAAGGAEEQEYRTGKRIYRHPDDKVLGGVCSGISTYFGIDPLWLRLIFAIAVIFYGTGILLYIILWIIIPEAKTTAEKLEMRGEKITISNIERSVKDEVDNLKKKVNDLHDEARQADWRDRFGKAGGFLQKLVDFFIALFKLLVKAIVKIAGVLLIIAGVIIAFILAVTILAGFGVIHPFMPMVFESHLQQILAITGVTLLIGLPLLFILLKGFQVIFNIKANNKKLAIGFSSASFIGLVICLIVAGQLFTDFSSRAAEKEEIPVNIPGSDTLYLDVENEVDKAYSGTNTNILLGDEAIVRLNDKNYFIDMGDKVAVGNVKLDIMRNSEPVLELVKVVKARGGSSAKAKKLLPTINYSFKQENNKLKFSSVFLLGKEELWRNQQVRMVLKVPENMTLIFSNDLHKVIYDVKNVQDIYDRNMSGRTWKMTEAGLSCMNCELNQNKSRDTSGMITMNYPLSDFNKLEVNSHFNVRVVQGDEYKVTVRGYQEAMDKVEVEQDGKELEFDYDHEWLSFDLFKSKSDVYIDITMPELVRAEFTGATEADVTGFNSDKMKITLSGASEGRFSVTTRELKMDVNGASEVKIKGRTDNFEATVNGASELNAESFIAESADITANGASEAFVNVTQKLKANANGASDIRYIGKPHVESEASGASSVKEGR